MQLSQFYYFREIANCKSISAAAKNCYQSTQNLSRIIKSLEDELECKLLERSATGVELTESGICVLRHAKQRIQEHESMLRELQLIKEKDQRKIHLLSAYGILRLVRPEAIIQFQEDHPNLTLIYQEFPDLDVEERFNEKMGNTAFMVGPIDFNLYDYVELISIPLSAIVHKDHPLASRESISLLDFKDEPLYLESTRFKVYHIVKDACEELGFTPNVPFQTSGFSLCRSVVSRGKGVSIIVDDIYHEMESKDIVKIPLQEDLAWKIYMVTRKGDPLTPAIMEFERFVLRQLRSEKE